MTNAAPFVNPTRGREIAVVGIDGTGKSTLAARLYQALNKAGHEAILIDKHSTEVPMDRELSTYVDRLNALVYRRDARVSQACGDHYWLLALAAWYTLQDKLVIKPALAAGAHVILDNSYHKILARYAVNPDVSTSLAEQVFAHLTEPDLVFFLRISARDALARKGGEFSSLETGHSGGADEDFIRHQDVVLAKLREHGQRGGWLPMDVTDMDRDAVFNTAADALADRLQLAICPARSHHEERTKPVPQPTDGEYVCHGITWATGDPRLLLAPLPDGPLVYAEIMNQRLGFAVDTGRWCTGRYQFADTVRVEALACPDRAPTEQNGQCARCFRQDEFRFAHQFHQDGNVPEALRQYMDQPHWLYLATFADGATKVGTAAEPRRQSRLDEQGALIATYLTKSPDGRAVRHLENALTRGLQMPQTVRASTKLKALATPTDLSAASATHEHHVARAADALTAMGISAMLEEWTPPAEGDRMRVAEGVRMLYPHDLRDGEHGFTVVSCVGTQVLAVLDGDVEVNHVLDLGTLKGRRITLGPFTSPAAAFQNSLF